MQTLLQGLCNIGTERQSQISNISGVRRKRRSRFFPCGGFVSLRLQHTGLALGRCCFLFVLQLARFSGPGSMCCDGIGLTCLVRCAFFLLLVRSHLSPGLDWARTVRGR